MYSYQREGVRDHTSGSLGTQPQVERSGPGITHNPRIRRARGGHLLCIYSESVISH